jgi:HlyD family secretion protein
MMKSNTPDVRQAAERSARKHILAGVAVIALVLGGTGVWAARTDISGAVVSSGMVVVESKVKKVQHPTGGVVSEIKVKNGSIVKAGDLLVRLDDTEPREPAVDHQAA